MKEKKKSDAKNIWPLLVQLHALYDIKDQPKKAVKKLTRSEIQLFGEPFSKTDFVDFWKHSREFLSAQQGEVR